jgi:glutathione S-transferase
MITLHQPPGAWGLPNLSPFCLKLESYLRMVGLPYQVTPADPRGAPKGKIPYVWLEDEKRFMGDSQLIIEHLKRKHGDPLDGRLGAVEVATGHAIRRMIEEGTYWPIVHDRWIKEAGWHAYEPVFQAMMPPLLRGLLPKVLRRKVRKMLYMQGTGRHRDEEIDAMGQADITAVATLLGDKPFLLGEAPTSFDATVYAFLMITKEFPVDSPLRRHTLAQENLIRYCQRFKERFFADWKPPA